jgi:two-component system response regulator FixJ
LLPECAHGQNGGAVKPLPFGGTNRPQAGAAGRLQPQRRVAAFRMFIGTACTKAAAMMPRGVVHIIDDDDGVRSSCAALARSAGIRVAEYGTAEEFLARYQGERPGCVLLDLVLPGMGGLEALALFRERGIALPVIVMTGYGSVAAAVASLKGGASDFFEKPINAIDLLRQIRHLLANDAEAAKASKRSADVSRRLKELSQREQEVLERIARGERSKSIATDLQISSRTVDAHRASIMRKLGVRSLAELLRVWLTALVP